jgi:t-SNARE complex subunit (syntaxin)
MIDPSLDVPAPTGPVRDPFNEGQAAARARRMRSLAIAFVLIAFVVLVFTSTVIRLASNVRQAHQPAIVPAHAPASTS